MIVMIAEQGAALDRRNPTLTKWAKRLRDTFQHYSGRSFRKCESSVRWSHRRSR